MPAKKPLTKEMARALHSFYDRLPLPAVEKAIDEGKKVELVESTFKDPTDFCSILVDEHVVFHAAGY